MKNIKKVEITQDENDPVSAEVLAASIKKLAEAVDELNPG